MMGDPTPLVPRRPRRHRPTSTPREPPGTPAGQRGWLWLLFLLPYAAVLVGVEVGARVRDPLRFQRLLRWLIVPIVVANLVQLTLLIATPLKAAVEPSAADELLSSIVL
jgi:hypothetical protein